MSDDKVERPSIPCPSCGEAPFEWVITPKGQSHRGMRLYYSAAKTVPNIGLHEKHAAEEIRSATELYATDCVVFCVGCGEAHPTDEVLEMQRVEEPEHWGNGEVPHVTLKRVTVKIDTVAAVTKDADPDGPQIRRVIEQAKDRWGFEKTVSDVDSLDDLPDGWDDETIPFAPWDEPRMEVRRYLDTTNDQDEGDD